MQSSSTVNTPFYSCPFSDLAFAWQRGWSWPRSTPASLPCKGHVTEQTTVKWSTGRRVIFCQDGKLSDSRLTSSSEYTEQLERVLQIFLLFHFLIITLLLYTQLEYFLFSCLQKRKPHVSSSVRKSPTPSTIRTHFSSPHLKSSQLMNYMYLWRTRSLLSVRELKQTRTATVTKTQSNKRFNEQNNSCARAL